MSDAFPFWMYVTMDYGKERMEHKALNGKVLPWDDPFWDTHYPPWDWGCRCMVIKMTKSQGEEKGIADSKALPGPSQNGFTFNPKDLTIDMDELTKDLPEAQQADVKSAFAKTSVAFPDGTTKTLTELNEQGFAPAITIEDAHKFILANIADGLRIPKSFKDVEMFNAINEKLLATMKKYALPKFKEFEINSRSKGIAFVRNYIQRSSIGFNPKEMADLKGIFSRTVTKKLENKQVRWLAIRDEASTLKHVIDHEVGHAIFHLSKSPTKSASLRDAYKKAISSGDISQISDYAKTDRKGGEFFAETFAMYERGDKLPDYVLSMIKEVLK
jgi:predicted SprT family Zn-dependent metalloprotease